jgi:uncharacterized membrane protein YgcG
MRLTVAITLLCGCISAAAGARQADTRWSPWLGCWQLAGDRVRVCVEPFQGATGVRLTTTVENTNDPVLAQTLVADGARQPVAEGDCSGWQQADWSATGERLFASAELTCTDGSTRKVTGLSTIVADTWIDIQGIEIAGRENIRVRRYRRAAAQAPSARATGVAPRLGATPLAIADIKEAGTRVSARVLEAAIVETGASFNLSSSALRDLDRAGVPDVVIDAMVAISYPRHFIVDRPAAPLGLMSDADPWLGAWAFPYYPSVFYDRYGYSPFLYSPFGYGYWASYYPYGYTFLPGGSLVPTTGALDPPDGSGGTGRAVNGLGYTRIRTRGEVAAEQAATRRRTDLGNGTDGSSSASSGSSSSGSSGSVSSSGFSSGSSSSDTGRTAQPR